MSRYTRFTEFTLLQFHFGDTMLLSKMTYKLDQKYLEHN